MQHAACDLTHATWNMKQAAYNMPNATCDMQHATCNMRHAACEICNTQHLSAHLTRVLKFDQRAQQLAVRLRLPRRLARADARPAGGVAGLQLLRDPQMLKQEHLPECARVHVRAHLWVVVRVGGAASQRRAAPTPDKQGGGSSTRAKGELPRHLTSRAEAAAGRRQQHASQRRAAPTPDKQGGGSSTPC